MQHTDSGDPVGASAPHPHLACWVRRVAAAVLVIAVATTGFMVLGPRAGLLHVDVLADTPTAPARLYFDRGAGFNEADSTVAWLHQGPNNLVFRLPPGEVHRVRLDLPAAGRAFQAGAMHFQASPRSGMQAVAPRWLGAGEATRLEPLGGRVRISRTGANPAQLVIEPVSPWIVPEPGCAAARALTSGLLLGLVAVSLWWFFLAPMWSWRAAVGISLLLILAMAAAMAWLSVTSNSVHPDEHAHLWPYQYYLEHLLPAPLDSALLHSTISVYGFSYLFELDVVYALAAWTAGAFSAWFDNDLLVARHFNLALLLMLAFLALRNARWALCLGVVLLSPQVWYLFGYFNADAFPFTLALIACCIVGDRGGGLDRYIEGRARFKPIVLLFVVAIGLLLVSKRNYLPVLPVLGLWLAVRHLDLRMPAILAILLGLLALGSNVHLSAVPGWGGTIPYKAVNIGGAALVVTALAAAALRRFQDVERRPILLRLMTVFLLGFAVAAPRVAIDLAQNGMPSQRAATLHDIAEARAGPGFKPSELGSESAYFGRALARRGVSLGDVMLSPYNWLSNSTASAYGIYGYLSIHTPRWLIVSLQAISAAVFLLALGGLFMNARPLAPRFALIVAGGTLLVAASSLLHSWTFDMQSQGRYLFPIFCMFGLMLAEGVRGTTSKVLGVLLGSALVLGSVSFIGTGLRALAVLP